MAPFASLARALRPALGVCFAFLLSLAASGQNAQVSGSLTSTIGDTGAFKCTGMPTCNGTWTGYYHPSGCNNAMYEAGNLAITGLALDRPGSVQGNATLGNWYFGVTRASDGTCTVDPGSFSDGTFPYTGTWNGSAGVLTLQAGSYTITLPFTASLAPPVFPMTVTTNITPVSATASAQIQFRPQDVGTQGSVYVFALAPATQVKNATSEKRAFFGMMARGAPADAPVQCVLAQLNPQTGTLSAVSAQTMQPYLTSTLSSQGASVSILNNVSTPNVAGATFFVGYGPTATDMIDNGVNQSAVTIPSNVMCQPQPPQTGWWWNPAEDGRGYSIEVAGHNIFFAAFLYDVSAHSTWYVSTGPVSLDGSLYVGALLSAKGGQTLGGPYPGFPTLTTVGSLTLVFSDASNGAVIWPGGTVPIQRFNMVPGGLQMPMGSSQPESGWWYNSQEAGRGFFMEWQGTTMDIAGYMYDDSGNPVWYLTYLTTSDPNGAMGHTVSGSWWSYCCGQTLTGAWQQNQQTSNNVAPVTINFTGPDTAIMTLPNGRTTSLTRQRF